MKFYLIVCSIYYHHQEIYFFLIFVMGTKIIVYIWIHDLFFNNLIFTTKCFPLS